MTPLVGILLALVTLEGLLLMLWPGPVRTIIQETPVRVLRIAGIVEVLFVLIVVTVILMRG